MAQDDAITQQAGTVGMPPAMETGQAGKQIGPIRLIRQIGKGGMGEVWLARHELLGEVAVKILSMAVIDQIDPAFREFIQGAKVAASLGHPGLNKVYHADVADGRPYLVLELLDGLNLQECVERSGRLGLPAARAVIEAVGDAVAELHHHDLVHRDIKPSNLVLTSDGRIVVTDFGLACARPVSSLRGPGGPMAGTPAYMAPEMFDGVVSARTDVYAIGMTAYQLLCGKPAFAGTLEELQRQQKAATIDVEPLRGAGVPEGVIEVIVRATSKDTLFRPKTARHVVEAFRAAFDAEGIQPASRETLARLLNNRASSDGPRTVTGSSGNLADALSQFAARKRDLQRRGPAAALAVIPVGGTAASPVLPPFAVPRLAYSDPPLGGRPGLVTAIAVMSIVVASLSLLFSLVIGAQALMFFAMSRVARSMPVTATTTTTASSSATFSSSSTLTISGTAAPTTTPATVPSTALTPIEIKQIIGKVQANLGTPNLNAQQVASLQTALQNPSQGLVAPGTSWSPVTSTSMQSNGTATINLSGGFVQIDAKGNIVLQVSNTTGFSGMPRVSMAPCVLSLFDGVASLGLAVLLLVAGIATLRQSRRSLRLHKIFGWVKIPMAILGGIAYGWMMSDMLTSFPGMGAGTGKMFFFVYAGFITGSGCAYPIGLLIALRSRTVRGYYQSIVESGA